MLQNLQAPKLTGLIVGFVISLYLLCSPYITQRQLLRVNTAGNAQIDLYGISELPVYFQRISAFDGNARNTLRIMGGRDYTMRPALQKNDLFANTAINPNVEPTKISAVQWYLDILSSQIKPDATHHLHDQIIRVDDTSIRSFLNIDNSDSTRLSLTHISELLYGESSDFNEAYENAIEKQQAGAYLDTYEKNILQLGQRLSAFMSSRDSFAPFIKQITDASDQKTIWAAYTYKEVNETANNAVTQHIRELSSRYTDQQLEENPDLLGNLWLQANQRAKRTLEQAYNITTAELYFNWRNLFYAWQEQDANAFKNELYTLHESYMQHFPSATKTAHFEAFADAFNLNSGASALCITAMLLVLLGWILPVMRAPLLWAAGICLTFAFLAQTGMLISRSIITQRPPVTNLYSSAVLVGWGITGLGVLMELIFQKWLRIKLGLGLLVAAVAGFMTMRIAFSLQLEGDTRAPLQAVLDTPFWLSTHVLMITLGYSATFLAGALGITSILGGVFTPALRNGGLKSLERTTYGVICFAVLLSFIGTILGGIWGDQSWGRFWGWDPKENGALMIVLWNAIILHARWAGWAKIRGIAIMAVLGNIVTAWSWFGVNQLGIGLHAYGFTDGTQKRLMYFAISQLLIVAAGCLPASDWLSLRKAKPVNQDIPSAPEEETA